MSISKFSTPVQAAIKQVMKRKDLSEADAITYMMGVAAGRLKALWRYDDSLPEGKANKGILIAKGNRKRAERSKAIVTLPTAKAVAS